MQLPGLDLPIWDWVALVAGHCRESRRSRPPWDAAKSVFELERHFEDDIAHNYRLSAQGIPHLRDWPPSTIHPCRSTSSASSTLASESSPSGSPTCALLRSASGSG